MRAAALRVGRFLLFHDLTIDKVQVTIHIHPGRTSPNSPDCPDPDCDPSVRESVWTQCAKRCKIPHFSLTERTYLTRKHGGFIEIYLTKQHEYTIFQSFFEYFNGGCKLQPPL